MAGPDDAVRHRSRLSSNPLLQTLSRRALGLTAIVGLSACSGDSTPSEPTNQPTTPGIRVVAGAAVDDTILAQPVQALVVEVRGSDGALVRGATVRFDDPQIAVSPGQAIVFYNGDVVVGGGWID